VVGELSWLSSTRRPLQGIGEETCMVGGESGLFPAHGTAVYGLPLLNPPLKQVAASHTHISTLDRFQNPTCSAAAR